MVVLSRRHGRRDAVRFALRRVQGFLQQMVQGVPAAAFVLPCLQGRGLRAAMAQGAGLRAWRPLRRRSPERREPDAQTPTISVSGLRKAYGGIPVLRGVDLAVGRGETVVLIGPSGAGKTTLLRCL